MESIEALRALGLTEYESKVYLSLLHLGPCTASDIFIDCRVPQNKVYEALISLASKSIVEIVPSLPKKYALNEVSSLYSLLRKKEEDLLEIKKEIDNLKQLKKNSLPISAKEVTYITFGHDAFVEKIKRELCKVSKENLIVATKIRKDPVILRLTEEAIRRGAKVKMILPKSERSFKEWKELGAQVRYSKVQVELGFSTFDNFICRVNFLENEKQNPTLWIENTPFVGLLRERFENLWKSAESR